MAKQTEVWRKVDGQAVRCTECEKNREFQIRQDVTGEDPPVGVGYECLVRDTGCIFLHKVPDNDKWYPGFREVYADIQANISDAIRQNQEGQ